MKRVISFILCGAMVLSLCMMTGCGKKENEQKPTGAGKWYMTSRASYDEDGILDEEWNWQYDRDGRLTLYSSALPAGLFNGYCLFSNNYGFFFYDNEGRLERRSDSDENTEYKAYYDAAGVLRLEDGGDDKGRLEYNEKGKSWRQFSREGDTLYLTFEATFDKNGNAIKQTYYADHTKYNRVQTKTVTEKAKTFGENMEFASQYERTDEIESIYEYTYDKAGNCLTQTKKDADGKIVSTIEYTYDGQGREESRTVTEDGIVKRHLKSYSAIGNLIQTSDYENDQLQQTREYTFDADNRLQDERLVTPDGETRVVVTYEYDKMGNCVKEVCYDNEGKVSGTFQMKYTFIRGATAEPVIKI